MLSGQSQQVPNAHGTTLRVCHEACDLRSRFPLPCAAGTGCRSARPSGVLLLRRPLVERRDATVLRRDATMLARMNRYSYSGFNKKPGNPRNLVRGYLVLPTRPLMETSMRKLLFLAAATTLASTLAFAQAQQSSPAQAPTKAQQNQAIPPSKNQPTTERRSNPTKANRNRAASRRTMTHRKITDARGFRTNTYAYRHMGRRHGRVVRAGGRPAYGYSHHRHLRYAHYGHRGYGYRAYGYRGYRGCD